MNDFTELGPGERIYASGVVQEYSWDEFKQRREQAQVEPVATEPVILRRASRMNDPVKPAKAIGRTKLTPSEIRQRDVKAELRRKRIEEDRYLAGLAKAQKALDKNIRIQQQQTRALTKAARLEEVQRRANNSIVNKPVFVPSPTVKQSYLPAGVPPIPGKTAIRVDHKTVIYVKDGHDIDEAVASYKHKHGLA